MRTAADAGLGVPVRLTGADDLMARSRIVENTVELDPEMPTLAEVREILDAPAEDEVDVSPAVAQDDGQSAANE